MLQADPDPRQSLILICDRNAKGWKTLLSIPVNADDDSINDER